MLSLLNPKVVHSMNEPSMAALIQQLRREKGLTQKELACQLNVTDKAVSKWERGLSSPDISLLIPLSELLGISTTELLQGRRLEPPPQLETEAMVTDALRYSHARLLGQLRQLRSKALLLVSAAALLAAAVCLICDVCLTGTLTWSGIVLLSLAFGWGVLVPLLREGGHRLRWALGVASLGIFPYLGGLGILLQQPLLFRLGWAEAGLAVAGLWVIYGLCVKLRRRKWRAAGAVLVLVAGLVLPMNHIALAYFPANQVSFPSDLVNTLLTLLLALACFGIDHWRNRQGTP